MAQIVMTNNLPVDKAIMIDEASTTVLYIGVAKAGTSQTASRWQIRKLSTVDEVISITFADGNGRYDNRWDQRASYDYS